MRIGFRDDANAGPTGVPQYPNSGTGLAHQQAQQVVVDNCSSHHAGVVAQFTDLGGCFIHKRPRVACHTHRARRKQTVVVTATEQTCDSRIVDSQAVTPHHDVHTGRIPTAHFETINRRQHLLNRQIRGQRRAACPYARQSIYCQRGSNAIFTQRPCGVAYGSQQIGSAFKRCCADRGIGVFNTVLKLLVAAGKVRVELVEPIGECCNELAVAGHEPHPSVATQGGIHPSSGSSHRV